MGSKDFSLFSYVSCRMVLCFSKLYQRTISAAAVWFRVRTIELSFPEKGTVKLINCVKVIGFYLRFLGDESVHP